MRATTAAIAAAMALATSCTPALALDNGALDGIFDGAERAGLRAPADAPPVRDGAILPVPRPSREYLMERLAVEVYVPVVPAMEKILDERIELLGRKYGFIRDRGFRPVPVPELFEARPETDAPPPIFMPKPEPVRPPIRMPRPGPPLGRAIFQVMGWAGPMARHHIAKDAWVRGVHMEGRARYGSREELRDFIVEHARTLLEVDGVTGVGIGSRNSLCHGDFRKCLPNRGPYVLVIHLHAPPPRPVILDALLNSVEELAGFVFRLDPAGEIVPLARS